MRHCLTYALCLLLLLAHSMAHGRVGKKICLKCYIDSVYTDCFLQKAGTTGGPRLYYKDSAAFVAADSATLQIRYAEGRSSTFIINGVVADSILPTGGDTAGLGADFPQDFEYDMSRLFYFRLGGSSYFIVPVSRAGCNGRACRVLMYFLLSYSHERHTASAWFFSNDFNNGYNLRAEHGHLQYAGVTNSYTDSSLALAGNTAYTWYYLNNYELDERTGRWLPGGNTSIYKAIGDDYGADECCDYEVVQGAGAER